MHVDITKKDILVLGEGSTQGLDDITIAAEAKYSIKTKQSEIKPFPLCLGSISKDFTINHMKKNKKETGLNGHEHVRWI